MKRYIAMIFAAAFLLAGCGISNDITSKEVTTTRSSQVTTNDISSETTTQITTNNTPRYTSDNILGLQDIKEDENSGSKSIIFTFLRLKNGAVNSTILSESSSISGLTPYGPFEFDKTEVIDNGDTFDIVLTYDSRITLNTVTFDHQDERCIIYLNDGLKLAYCDFSDINISKKTFQNYNADTKSWEESYNEEEVNEIYDTVEPSIYTVKDIYHDADAGYPVNTYGDIRFQASKFKYTAEAYDIYGEISRPAATSLMFDIISIKDPVYADITEKDIRIYKKNGKEYNDITPADISISLSSYKDGKFISVTVESSTLGDLDEGDYRVECGGYSVDFTLAMQTYEVW